MGGCRRALIRRPRYRPVRIGRPAATAPRSGARHQRLPRPARPAGDPRRPRAARPPATRHLQATDPTRFLVATAPDARTAASGSSAFGSAVVRGALWFLSMLFVRPERAGARARPGAARAASLPGRRTATRRRLATATDSAQPISNGLYARYGHRARGCRSSTLVGGCRAAARRSGRCPPGIDAIAVRRASPPGRPEGRAIARWPRRVDALDRELLGLRRTRATMRFLRAESRDAGSSYRGPDGRRSATATPARSAGSGPIAVARRGAPRADPRPPRRAVQPRGAFGRLGAGRRRRRARAAAPGRLPDRRLPGAAVLGPPVRRLQPLPADLARAALRRRRARSGRSVLGPRRGRRRRW